MIILALTGSIGMGKSTTAQIFSDAGIPVYSADNIVHRLYSGQATALIEATFPGTTQDHIVDREKLFAAISGKQDAWKTLETIIHPLVHEAEEAFLKKAREAGADLVLLEIPLLFETNAQSRVDKIIVVTASSKIQRERVLARPGMNQEKFNALLANQISDCEKRARADFVIDTGKTIEEVRAEVSMIICQLRTITETALNK